MERWWICVIISHTAVLSLRQSSEVSHPTICKALTFFLDSSWCSACCSVVFRGFVCPYAAVVPKWDIKHHFDLGVRSSGFFHKQKPECVTQHRVLSSGLNRSMWTKAGERRMKGGNGMNQHRPISVFLTEAPYVITRHISRSSLQYIHGVGFSQAYYA